MKRVLVTGGSGLVGSTVVGGLASIGYDVMCPGRSQLDLSDESSCRFFFEACEPPDVIVHCAAVAHGEDLYSSLSIRANNSAMLKNLVVALGDMEPRIIFLSSISVYDGVKNPNYCGHLSPPCTSQYGKGKLDDEQFLRDSVTSFGILRLAPFFNKANRCVLGSRVYIVRDLIKLKISPAPRFQFCSDKLLIQRMASLIESPLNSISIVGESDPQVFDDLPGCNIVVPRWLSVSVAKIAAKISSGAFASKLKKALDPNFIDMPSLLFL